MAFNLSAFAGAGAQLFTDNGDPLVGGLVYVYAAGTTTPVTTWTTNSGTTANTNPIVLDAAGRTPNEIWVTGGVMYKFIVRTSTSVLIGTYDNIPAIDDRTAFNNLITVTGTNSLIGTSVPPYTSYLTGMTISFAPVAVNTGAVTIDLDGLGAKSITFDTSALLTSGVFAIGQIVTLQYDGTRFQMLNGVTTNKIANDAVTAAKIGTGAVTEAKIGTGAVTVDKIGTGAVTVDKIATDAVTQVKIANDAVGTAEIINANVTAAKLSGAQSGTAPIYGARAWVNFDGTGSTGANQTIRASGNVSTVYKNGSGDFTVTFSTAMPDANYAVVSTPDNTISAAPISYLENGTAPTTSAFRIIFSTGSGVKVDNNRNFVAVFR